MKILTTTLLAFGISTTALADRSATASNQFIEYANVINASPIYREVSFQQPKRECWVEEQQHVIRNEGQGTQRRNQSSNGGDVLIGGVIGGVIGNQLGRKGSNSARAGATVAGAIIGSALAGESGNRSKRHRRESKSNRNNRYQRQPSYETRPVKRCENTTETHYEQRLQGYDVTYRYRGKTFQTRMKQDPGNKIKVQVTVRPLR